MATPTRPATGHTRRGFLRLGAAGAVSATAFSGYGLLRWAPVVALYQEVKVYGHSARVLRFTPLPELNMDFRGVAVKK